MREKKSIHERDSGIVLAFGLLFLSVLNLFIIGILQTNGIITQDLGSGLVIGASGFCFLGSMFCLIA